MELVAADAARLAPERLASLPDAVARPTYDRAALRVGIVHLGLGAFARAHLAAVNEAALHAGAGVDVDVDRGLGWGICGVSLRQTDTRDALAPQAGLYALALRSARQGGGEGEGGCGGTGMRGNGGLQQQIAVIGCLIETLVAPEDPNAVLTRIAHADTRIVSVTVTEKGYCHDPATGRLNLQHPDIVHDLAHPLAPRSTIGYLVWGLQQRRAAGRGAITLMSLDNLPGNGHLLRGMVLAFARQLDPALAAWIDASCAFPCSMVDRIVPRTTNEDRRAVARALGLHDAWPVVGEPYLEWVVEDQFAAGRPDWAAGGARFVSDAAPFETLKLRTVNGLHSALAYLSVMAGWATVDEAMAQPALKAYLAALMQDEIVPTLPTLPGLDLAHYQQRLLQRFENPALKHQTRQIAMDGSQKLPQRLLDTVRARLAADLPIDKLALAVAAWLHFLRGVDEAGRRFDIQDPMAAELAQRLAEAERAVDARSAGPAAMQAWTETLIGVTAVFGDLGDDPRFVRAVSQAAHALRTRGVAGALSAQGLLT